VHLERAVLATLDFATTAEDQSFQTEDFRAAIAKLAVNAVPFVCAASPGIRSTADLPQIVARLG
jgi:hypothetical protein